MENLFRGVWYRSEVKLEGETIIPIPPFESYNPFDEYYAASDVRQGERSVYFEFLAVDPDKPEEVVKFCQRFGALGEPGKAWTRTIKDSRRRGREFLQKLEVRSPPDQEKSYLTMLERTANPIACSPEDLCFPLTISQFRSIQLSFQREINNPLPGTKGCLIDLVENWENTWGHAFSSFERESLLWLSPINKGLFQSNVRPNLRWNALADKWELFWLSFSLIGYFWVMFMLDQLGPGKILSCPRCHKFFLTASNRTKHCSPSCYEVLKVQKYQKKKREEVAAAKKGKKVSTRESTGKR